MFLFFLDIDDEIDDEKCMVFCYCLIFLLFGYEIDKNCLVCKLCYGLFKVYIVRVMVWSIMMGDWWCIVSFKVGIIEILNINVRCYCFYI